MANTFLNAKQYANVMLLLLKNQLVMGRLVDGKYNSSVTDENGLTVYVKRPPRFIAKDGATLAEQAIAVGETSLSINRYRNVHIGISDLEYVQSWNALMKNETMKSAASTLAHDVDLYLHQQLLSFPSHVGTAGQAIMTPQQAFKAHTRLMDQAVPNVDLSGVLTFEDAENIRGALLGSNIQGTNKDALEKVRIPVLSEVDFYATQNVSTLTNGTRSAGAGQMVGASQNVDYVSVKNQDYQTISIDTLGAAATIKKGEIFTIAGVYAVNPRTQQTLTYLRQFTVVEDATASGGGAVTALKIYPPMIVAGTGGGEADTNTAFATVSAANADDALLTFVGAASLSWLTRAVFNKQAIQLVSARLATPLSDTSSFATDPETGISLRYWRGSDIATGRHIHRWDMIYGAKAVDPRLGVRLSGTALS